jgi:hypothetical protein
MDVASFKSSDEITHFEAEKAFQTLRDANFILIGPGSPSYAVRQWERSPIPDILVDRITLGSRLVAASAAALTIGRFTLPVYEIYKVGEPVHWLDGLNILGHFGLDVVVIPHWNNAEGGTHDTRFCYMGEPRFRRLESLLPEGVPILGLDEHTACIVDVERRDASVMGIGRVTLRHRGSERIFKKGDKFSLETFHSLGSAKEADKDAVAFSQSEVPVREEVDSFWERVHSLEEIFRNALNVQDSAGATNALLELDKAIWEAQDDLESAEYISQAREVMRDLMVVLGVAIESKKADVDEVLTPLVESLLEVRELLRKERDWDLADKVREAFSLADVIIEDTREGPQWRLKQE